MSAQRQHQSTQLEPRVLWLCAGAHLLGWHVGRRLVFLVAGWLHTYLSSEVVWGLNVAPMVLFPALAALRKAPHRPLAQALWGSAISSALFWAWGIVWLQAKGLTPLRRPFETLAPFFLTLATLPLVFYALAAVWRPKWVKPWGKMKVPSRWFTVFAQSSARLLSHPAGVLALVLLAASYRWLSWTQGDTPYRAAMRLLRAVQAGDADGAYSQFVDPSAQNYSTAPPRLPSPEAHRALFQATVKNWLPEKVGLAWPQGATVHRYLGYEKNAWKRRGRSKVLVGFENPVTGQLVSGNFRPTEWVDRFSEENVAAAYFHIYYCGPKQGWKVDAESFYEYLYAFCAPNATGTLAQRRAKGYLMWLAYGGGRLPFLKEQELLRALEPPKAQETPGAFSPPPGLSR